MNGTPSRAARARVSVAPAFLIAREDACASSGQSATLPEMHPDAPRDLAASRSPSDPGDRQTGMMRQDLALQLRSFELSFMPATIPETPAAGDRQVRAERDPTHRGKL